MDNRADADILIEEISETLRVVSRIDRQYRDFLASDYRTIGRKHASAVVIADAITGVPPEEV